jgi:TorA maturation chaperone TorD
MIDRTGETGALHRFAQAVADDLDMLAVLHAQELTAQRLTELKSVNFPDNLGLSPDDGHGRDAARLMATALRTIPDPPDAVTLDRLAADYAAIYINGTYRATPAESVWIDEDGLAYQLPMFQVRAWYQRHGLAAENWRKRSDDHLVMQLQFIAFLCRRAEAPADLSEPARFLDEHLLRWLTDFSQRVASRCETSFYAGLCLLTAAYVGRLRDLVALATGEVRPTPEAIEERMKPGRQVAEAEVKYMPGMGPSW